MAYPTYTCSARAQLEVLEGTRASYTQSIYLSCSKCIHKSHICTYKKYEERIDNVYTSVYAYVCMCLYVHIYTSVSKCMKANYFVNKGFNDEASDTYFGEE